MRDKFLYLFKNTGLLFVSNFASKILVFLLVPFYTSILTTEEYGTYDLLHTTVQLLMPVLTLNIIDAVMRFSIDAEREEQKKIFTVGLKYIFIAIAVLVFGVGVCSSFFEIQEIELYSRQFILLFIAYTINTLFYQFARGINDVVGIAIAGVVGTIAMITFNLLFLLWFRWGIHGYFYAMSLSLAIPALYLFLRCKLWRYILLDKAIIKKGSFDKNLLTFCLPLLVINLSWYINNVSDRYVVTMLCGVDANGVYSVAYKIPSILNAVQVIFIQAWQLSAIKEYDAKDGEPFYRRTYQGCQIVMVMLCSCIIFGTKIIARILFAKDFFEAWVYVPVLLIYIVFNTLSGTIGGIFSATKDSKQLAHSAIVGAVLNIVLNFILVYLMGPMGAAIATVISSVVIWAMRVIASRKYMKLQVNFKAHIVQYVLLIFQAIAMIAIESMVVVYGVQIVILVILIVMNLREVRMMKNGLV